MGKICDNEGWYQLPDENGNYDFYTTSGKRVGRATSMGYLQRIVDDHRLAALVPQLVEALEAIAPRCDFVTDRDRGTRCGAIAVAEGSFGLKYCFEHKGDREIVDAGAMVHEALKAARNSQEG
jgi:hypothetical protein